MNSEKVVSNVIFKKITSLLVSYGAKKISVFGSYARGEANL